MENPEREGCYSIVSTSESKVLKDVVHNIVAPHSLVVQQ